MHHQRLSATAPDAGDDVMTPSGTPAWAAATAMSTDVSGVFSAGEDDRVARRDRGRIFHIAICSG